MTTPKIKSGEHASSRRLSPYLAPVAVFLISAALSTGIIWRIEQDRYALERNRALILAHTRANPIQNSIDRALSATYSVAALVRQGKGTFPDFSATVSQLLPFYPGIASLDIAPGGVISDIVPFKGNEKAIGFDILSDPKQKKEAALARDSGKLTLAGPLNLIEGGLGAVGRLPIFLDHPNGTRVFWGLTCVVLKFPDVLVPARLDDLINQGYQYELWRIHPESRKKQTIAASSSIPLDNPVDYHFEVHNGKWILSITPARGWSDSWGLMLKAGLGALISMILAFSALLLVKLQAHKNELEEKVFERTADLEKEVAAHKLAEETLQIRERYQRALLDNFPFMVWLKDIQGRFLAVNHSFAITNGARNSGELVGKSDFDIWPHDLAEVTKADDLALLSSGQNKNIEEEVSDHGVIRWFEIYKAPVIGETGEPLGTVGFARDITERKHAEEERRLLERQYQQAKKLESLGVLAGGIAHDFNNVLSGIIGYTNMSLQYADNNSRLEKNMLQVLQASNRAKDMVKQILTFSRQGNPLKMVTPLTPIINEVLDLLKGSVPSSVLINTELHDDTKPVLADSTKIHELILNLATNAVHAMERRGTLTIRLYADCLDCGMYGQVQKIPAGDYTVIEVSDTGCGMDSETLSKAFEPFFTTKAVNEGTGMGLSVVIGVVQSHGGDIQVESMVGKGTTFRIYLPVSAESVPIEDTDDPDVQIYGTERILFVDDEPMLLEIAENSFREKGFIVTCISSSQEALSFLRENCADIDILVTDHMMPGMTGVELAKEVQKIRKDLPIILCTGYNLEINPQRAKAIGISQLVTKPLDIHKLSRLLRKLLDNKNEESAHGKNTGP
jgi:two-component system, cell cycle sensor histidine kinase and response regulator CckA